MKKLLDVLVTVMAISAPHGAAMAQEAKTLTVAQTPT